MKLKLFVAFSTGCLLLAQTTLVFGASTESGFKSIFNGKNLEGWDGNPKLWSAKDGTITGRTTAEDPLKGNTFLIWTNGTVGDFELRCSFRITPNNDEGFANSGIQYRSKILDANDWVVGGYQADMEAGPTYTGILYEERMTRAIMAARGEKVIWSKDCQKQLVGSLGKSEELQAAIKKGDWNEYVIIAQGNHLQHFINGKQTIEVTDNCEEKRATNGVLALQLHKGQPMTVQFRDLRLKAMAGGEHPSAAEGFKKLQGAWQATGGEANGEAIPSESLTAIVVTIKEHAYSAELTDRTDHGTLEIDPSKEPKQMDIHTENGNTMLAIYEVGEISFKVCYARRGGSRPTAFSTSGDDGLLLITYKRKQD